MSDVMSLRDGSAVRIKDVLLSHSDEIRDLRTEVEQLQERAIDTAGVLSTDDPERYIRTNITKNSKGYNAETTVSVTMTGSLDELERELTDLNRIADRVVRYEIHRREYEDRLAVEQGDS